MMRAIAAGFAGVLGVFVVLGTVLNTSHADATSPDDGWRRIDVPPAAADGERAPAQHFSDDGFGWYRCFVRVPENWAQRWELTLSIEQLASAYEVYFNGERIATAGALPPDFADASDQAIRHTIPSRLVRRAELNHIALRVHAPNGDGGFHGRPPALTDYNSEIVLRGPWQFRAGDDLSFAEPPEQTPGDVPVYEQVVGATQVRSEPSSYQPGESLPPKESHAALEVADDLAVDLVLADPKIEQPLHMSFDAQGRLWVVEYRQYPYPAGLRMVSRDIYWRAVWEPDLPPPPYAADSPFRGRDRITIHEDTDGDGVYDAHETFLDGLNITTAVAHGRGGVWVLSPPHLLFYPLEEGGTKPSGPPEVHLEGFGLEDTHSVANSLTWGPDGWLYAAQGSTVSGAVRRPGSDDEPVRSTGQNIWRYHPETGRCEIFAEGGGNAFGVEIDARGRMFSGHNGGDTRGFHYVQGGYYLKGFAKHGPLSNPYAFGYFPAMGHERVPRFTHAFVIYEGGALPQRYHGNLLGVEPMQGRIVHSDVLRDGSTFRTTDLDRPVTSSDPAFRPVTITTAPDGSVYVADFYSQYIAHGEHYEGYLNRETGRIYRLRAADAEPRQVNLAGKSTDELIDLLADENRAVRRLALRLLGDRRDTDALPRLRELLRSETGQLALEALWALNLSGGEVDAIADIGLGHDNPHVRRWTVRLLGDDGHVTDEQAGQLTGLAADEPNVEVRSQLASTARRIDAGQAMRIIDGLTTHDDDAADPHLPLLIWWAIETHAGPETRDAVLGWLESDEVWHRPLVREHLLSRVAQRFAATGRRSDLLICAKLLDLAPDRESSRRLVSGIEQAFASRDVATLPEPLVEAMADAGVASLTLRVRQGESAAIEEALGTLRDAEADTDTRIDHARLFGEVDEPRSIDALLEVAGSDESTAELRATALASLRSYRDDRIGERVLDFYNALPASVMPAAQTLLASRPTWSRQWLEAIDAGEVDPAGVSPEIVEAVRLHDDAALQGLVERHFVQQPPASEDVRDEIARIERILDAGDGDPYDGHPVYMASCGACHRMFDHGGSIGPDLTSYQRHETNALLRAIVDPNADIREGYEGVVVTTDDGRTIMGFLADQDRDVLVIRGLDGQDVTLSRDRIAEQRAMNRSLMPENLLAGLSDQQIRDLFAFLRTSQPIQP